MRHVPVSFAQPVSLCPDGLVGLAVEDAVDGQIPSAALEFGWAGEKPPGRPVRGAFDPSQDTRGDLRNLGWRESNFPVAPYEITSNVRGCCCLTPFLTPTIARRDWTPSDNSMPSTGPLSATKVLFPVQPIAIAAEQVHVSKVRFCQVAARGLPCHRHPRSRIGIA